MLLKVRDAAKILSITVAAVYKRTDLILVEGVKCLDMVAEVKAVRARCFAEGLQAGREELAAEMKDSGTIEELSSLTWAIARGGQNSLAQLKAIELLKSDEKYNQAMKENSSISITWDDHALSEAAHG